MTHSNGTIAIRIPPPVDGGENWLAQAEAIGKVEIESWFGKQRASIRIGDWGDVQLRVWFDAGTTNEALRGVVEKTRRLVAGGGHG